jgi:hypothetical protein
MQSKNDLVFPEIAQQIDPSIAETVRTGVPCRLVGGGYRPLEIVAGFGDGLVKFASNELDGFFCLEVASGQIVETDEEDPTARRVVNSSLSQFTACVGAFNARYPYYPRGLTYIEWTNVANELESILGAIDPVASAFQGFWEDVLASVSIGDYATESITDGLETPITREDAR